MARKKSVSELYRRGLSLADAAFEFAPDSLMKGYSWSQSWWKAKVAAADLQLIITLRSPGISESTRTSIASQLKIDLRNPPNDPFCNRDPNKYLRVYRSERLRPNDYERSFERDLMENIHQGKYVVIGIELPRSSKSKPTRVPDDVLRSSFGVDWNESALAGNGLEFVAVRVVPIEPGDGAELSHGRPSRRDEIRTAYGDLRAQGAIAANDEPQSVTNKIYKALTAAPGSNGSGLHHHTMWRHVRDLHWPTAKRNTKKRV